MTETVVNVETIEQWKSVLDVWFAQGYEWFISKGYRENYFRNGTRQLAINTHSDNRITYFSNNDYTGNGLIEYADFMAQQEKTMAKETYYVTQEQLDFINKMYEELYSLDELLNCHSEARKVFDDFSISEGNAVLRCLGGDPSIEFKVKETLYRLWRIDTEHDKVYMKFTATGNPGWTMDEDRAFTAPLEEIKKHKTVSWEIEKAD